MKASARLLLVSALLTAGLVASAETAMADHHFMKITEVYAGHSSEPNAQLVELQMYSGDQNFVGGHSLELYAASGSFMDCTIPQNTANPAPQSHILFATTEMGSINGAADFTIPGAFLSGTGGAVCFESVDCVSWGSFAGAASATDVDGGPGPPEAEIPLDTSIHRNLGGDGLLQSGDDTNNSANDFSPATDSGENSGGANLGPLSCTQGTGGGGGGGGGDPDVSVNNLKTKTPGNKAVISGAIDPPDPGGKVKLTLFANGSPLQKVGKKSDTLDAGSTFKKKFTVPSGSTRCKVTVKYNGREEAKKKFAC